MSKKTSARKSTKTKGPMGNLKPKARREIGVRGGTIRKRYDDAANAVVQKIG
jgi:hypothetical protein